MYTDIQAALMGARAAGGAIFRLPSAKKATAWRLRAYYYRTLLCEKDEAAHQIPGYSGTTEWDDVRLIIDPADPTGVRIEFGTIEGKLETFGGEQLEAPKGSAKAKTKPVAPVDADLLAAAESLVMEIDKS